MCCVAKPRSEVSAGALHVCRTAAPLSVGGRRTGRRKLYGKPADLLASLAAIGVGSWEFWAYCFFLHCDTSDIIHIYQRIGVPACDAAAPPCNGLLQHDFLPQRSHMETAHAGLSYDHVNVNVNVNNLHCVHAIAGAQGTGRPHECSCGAECISSTGWSEL